RNDLTELRVAQVRVDLGGIVDPSRRQPERAHRPVEIMLLVVFTQREQLPKGRLIDLDDSDTGLLEVDYLITDGEGHLLCRIGQRLVVADERPREDRHRAGE